MRIWLAQHANALRLALRRLQADPVTSLLSLLAIGVALALPAGGRMLVAGAAQLAGGGGAAPQISVFMSVGAVRAAATDVGTRLGKFAGVAKVEFLARESTLTRMSAGAGLREVILSLPENPFPDAFVVTVTDERPEAMESLAAEFRRLPGVEHVQLDSDWVRRLDALLGLGRLLTLVTGTLLGAGLVAIAFSLIRMQMLARRAEIELSLLLGATDGFIRRPFLYFGVLLGLGGGAVAWLLVAATALALRGPVGEFARLYDVAIVLRGLDYRDSLLLLAFAAGLGWLGAWLSATRHMRTAE